MELHKIQRPDVKHHKKRLGKGQATGQGGTAGKGNKGQESRSGGNIPAWFEGGQMPIQRRLPKRGFKNRFRIEYRILNLDKLEQVEDSDLTIEKMEKLGLIRSPKKNKISPVKILSNGGSTFTRKINNQANAFSKAAKELIEKNGGKAEVV